jgi:hypothetical protein
MLSGLHELRRRGVGTRCMTDNAAEKGGDACSNKQMTIKNTSRDQSWGVFAPTIGEVPRLQIKFRFAGINTIL